jgi:hypothetical protein
VRVEDVRTRKTRWVGGSAFTNPTSGTVLADTGAVSSASPSVGTIYEYGVVASSTVAAQLLIEHRDATDASTVESFNVFLPAGVVAFFVPVRLVQNERVRVVLVSGITGSISVALLETRAYD